MSDYTPEQQAENRAKWVAALRSGNYQQGKNYLHGGDKFCCLGVACEVARSEGVIEYTNVQYDGSGDVLSDRMQDWLGFADECGEIREGVEYGEPDPVTGARFAGSLTELNDWAGYTFDQIADLVESGGVHTVGAS